MLNGNEYELLLDFSLPHFVTAFPISPLIIISIFPESKTTPKNYFHLLYHGILFRFNSNHRDKKGFNKSIFILYVLCYHNFLNPDETIAITSSFRIKRF